MASWPLSRVFLKGSPPFLAFELGRMGAGWYELAEGSHAAETDLLAVLEFTEQTTREQSPRREDRPQPAPVFGIGISSLARLAVPSYSRQYFNVAEPLDRLALLAALADLRLLQRQGEKSHRSASDLRRPARPVQHAKPASLAARLHQIQWAFDLHLTARQLSERLDVHPSTVLRWSRLEGESVGRILQRGRVTAALDHIERTGDSIAATAECLGFSDPANLARMIRRTKENRPRR
jgi:AraC-like DNA-binding protein